MRKHYPFLLTVDGAVSERYDVEAESVTEAVFLMGVQFGQDHPRAITAAHAFKITKLWGNPE
ncbi:MAG TPA: hypothetical protein VFE08_14565 [Candidatus Sulfotelmatobacter sp.]|jgi:hypothetical protein|nr:hypothetical protein [Candidatus Sulfotelmatobacter sp.]